MTDRQVQRVNDYLQKFDRLSPEYQRRQIAVAIRYLSRLRRRARTQSARRTR